MLYIKITGKKKEKAMWENFASLKGTKQQSVGVKTPSDKNIQMYIIITYHDKKNYHNNNDIGDITRTIVMKITI